MVPYLPSNIFNKFIQKIKNKKNNALPLSCLVALLLLSNRITLVRKKTSVPNSRIIYIKDLKAWKKFNSSKSLFIKQSI